MAMATPTLYTWTYPQKIKKKLDVVMDRDQNAGKRQVLKYTRINVDSTWKVLYYRKYTIKVSQ